MFAVFGRLQRVDSFAAHLPLLATVWLSLRGVGVGGGGKGVLSRPSGVSGKHLAAVSKPTVTVEAALN